VEKLLTDSKRTGGAVLIRNEFVQQGPRGSRRAGPLARFIRAGAKRALNQYLLLLALASARGDDPKHPWHVRRAGEVWHRALGFPESEKPATIVSKHWRWLADAQLIKPGRKGRLSAPALLREDGSGTGYESPTGKAGDTYFKLPFAYWLDATPWYRELELPGIAMLLVALNEGGPFELPVARVPEWYGISKDTAMRGLRELRRRDLLGVTIGWKQTGFVEGFYTQERTYTLLPPFDPEARK
jgi:hypothetical protein